MSGTFAASTERRLLQVTVAIATLIPLSAGLAVMTAGPAALIPATADLGPDVDSHMRYLSGLLFAIGLAFWSTIPRIDSRGARFRLLTGLVFIGGLGRLASLAVIGVPSAGMVAGLAMELLVTPLIALWRERVERLMK
jgi:hypothetical protein